MKYFAYGTLLDLETMRRTAPSAQPLGIMRLDGYRLGFAQCADGKSSGCTLEPDANGVIYGVQYDLSDEDMAKMDAGAVSGDQLWHHKSVKLIDDKGDVVESVTYVVAGQAQPIIPTADYVRLILKGLNELDFPGDYAATTTERISQIQNAG